MCRHFTMILREVVDEIIQEVEVGYGTNLMPDWPAVSAPAYPGAHVPLIIPGTAGLTTEILQWGYEVSWNKNRIFNTRADTALRPGGNMWAESLHNRRCVIPTLGFHEPHMTETFPSPKTGKSIKREYLFTLPDSPILFIAGVYEGPHFSLMTTEPNQTIASIHDRMPVVLRPEEIKVWLEGDYCSLFDRKDIHLVATPVD